MRGNSTPYFTLPQVQVCEVSTLHPGQAGSGGSDPLPALLLPGQVYSGVIMRTQRAHYGRGTVFGTAVSPGVPALEMLAVEK